MFDVFFFDRLAPRGVTHDSNNCMLNKNHENACRNVYVFFYGLARRGVTRDLNNCMINKNYGMHVEMYLHVFFSNSTFEEGDMIITITL